VNPSSTDWVEFSERASLLQAVSLSTLSKPERIAFFLNVFHTLLLHAFVVLGMPSSGMDWRTLKISASYEIAGDVVSLRDIDEYILGRCMRIFSRSFDLCDVDREFVQSSGSLQHIAGEYLSSRSLQANRQ
jgi:hypothetical protein